MVRIAINGFGRIGRAAFKIAFERRDVEIVAINDLADVSTLAYLLQYDSNYGIYSHRVTPFDRGIIVAGRRIPVFSTPDPTRLPWGALGVDVVMECSGRLREPNQARAHLSAGAQKVVISAPVKGDSGDVKTIVLGVNEETVVPDDQILSNASCTTNCVAPIMKIIDDAFGVSKAMMTTIHSYTSSQALLDGPAADPREARSAAENIVPTSTGASQAAALTIPSLKGKFNGLSVRVPTPVVSLADITAVTRRSVTAEELNQLFELAANEPYYQGILSVTRAPLVSSDLKGNSHSCVIDLSLTDVVEENLVKVVAWYDNEWGYANRLVELSADLGSTVSRKLTIFVGADYDGRKAKSAIVQYLQHTYQDVDVVDVATALSDSADLNEPTAVAEQVSRHPAYSYGILLQGSEANLVNQIEHFPHLEAVNSTDLGVVRASRQHRAANVLCLSTSKLSFSEMRNLTRTFLQTPSLPHEEQRGEY